MDVADDIAYGVHDLEDAIALGLISADTFKKLVPEEDCSAWLTYLKASYLEEPQNDVYDRFVKALFSDSGTRKRFIGRMVAALINNVSIVDQECFEEPLLRFKVQLDNDFRKFLDSLQSLVSIEVIKSANVQQLELKGQIMIVSVFEALQSNPKELLPKDIYNDFNASNQDPRVICDYVAAMTDGALLKSYDRLFSPRMGSIFDRL